MKRSEREPSGHATVVVGPGVMVRPPEPVADHVPFTVLQSASAVNEPPAANVTVYFA